MRLDVSVLAVSLCLCGPARAVNLIVGGGFESPPAPAGNYLLNVTPTGWTGTGDMVAQGYAGAVSSGDGLQWFDLNPGTSAGTGLSQLLTLTAGTPYAFSFLYNGGQPSAGFTTAIAYTVSTPTSTLLTGTVSTAAMNVYAGTPWALYASSFVVAAQTAVTVRFQPNGVWANGFIDAVSVSAVPEPHGLMTMLLGLGVVALGVTTKPRSPKTCSPRRRRS